jgi:hypothetical protein
MPWSLIGLVVIDGVVLPCRTARWISGNRKPNPDQPCHDRQDTKPVNIGTFLEIHHLGFDSIYGIDSWLFKIILSVF